MVGQDKELPTQVLTDQLKLIRIFWEGHKICEISTLLLSTVHTDKSKVEISQNFVAFSEYMNFKTLYYSN